MNGPYGIVIRFTRPTNIGDSEVEKTAQEVHKIYRSLPGFRSVMYYNIDEKEYAVVLAFFTRKSAEDALDPISKSVKGRVPDVSVSMAAVSTGDFVDEVIATGGRVQRER